MNIAICDDIKSYNDSLYFCLEKYMADNKIKSYSIKPYTSGKELAGQYSRGLYDLIFLDIDMPELGGYETAEYVMKLDRNVGIVFVTNMAGEVYNSFRYSPKDFLCKPVRQQNINELMDRLFSETGYQAEDDLYDIKLKGGGSSQLHLPDVIYLESDNKFALASVTTSSEGIRFASSMDKAAADLESKGFVRISRSIIVNRLYVFAVFNEYVVLKDGINFSIGKTYRKSVNESLKGIWS